MADESKKDPAGAAQAAAANSAKDPLAGLPKGGAGSAAPAAQQAPHPARAVPVAAAEESELVRFLRSQQRQGPAVGPTEGISETVPGGKYRVGDAWLNADGEEIDEEGNLLHPERARKDQFGRVTTNFR